MIKVAQDILSAKDKKRGFSLVDVDEEIPAGLRPEDGWITPQSRKMGKRARFTEQDRKYVESIMKEELGTTQPNILSPAPQLSKIVWAEPFKSSRVKMKPTNAYQRAMTPKTILRKPLDDEAVEELTVRKLKESIKQSENRIAPLQGRLEAVKNGKNS